MSVNEPALLPLHEFLARLEHWQTDPSAQLVEALNAALERVATAYDVRGVFVTAEMPPLPSLSLRAGSYAALIAPPADHPANELGIDADGGWVSHAWIDANTPGTKRMLDALELSISALGARQAFLAHQRQLDALDAAVRSIAGVMSVDRVLQLIVDTVRQLVGAQYAALGIVGQFGQIEQFITSGISDEVRALLGPPPRGHGLLGLIIREDRPLLIDDIATDPRRYGFPEHHPPMHSLLGVPVRSKGQTIGNLYLTDKTSAAKFSEDDLRLVERFALHAGIAIENARLHDEIGRLAIVEERQRISQDLHDSIIQSLYATSLSLEDLPEISAEDQAEGEARVERAIESIHATIRDIRNFIMGLQPELLVRADLVSGIETLAAEFRMNTLVDLDVHVGTDLPMIESEAQAHLLAVTREALSNIARHANATRASIDLVAHGSEVTLTIRDNGRGFDVADARGSAHHGIANLHKRAEALDGTLDVRTKPGAGTRIELKLEAGSARPATAVTQGEQIG